MKLVFFTSEFLSKERIYKIDEIKTTFEYISYLKAEKKKIIFHCNKLDQDTYSKIKGKLQINNIEIDIVQLDNITNPEDLGWEHKKYLKWFIDSDFDYFIYTEDDLLWRDHHIKYWIENRKIIRQFGLPFMPAFLRFEYNHHNVMTSVDCTKQIKISERPILELNNKRYISHLEPFQSCFILDKLDAIDHLNANNLTRADFLKNIKTDYSTGYLESACSLPMFEHVPIGWDHRYVLSLHEIPNLLIHHISNKFSRDPRHYPFGTIAIENLIIP